MGFIQKTINPTPRVGIDLIEFRKKAGLSLADASRITKIPEYLIRALEEERWEEIQDPVYFEHIFKSYLDVLGANTGYFLEKYRECVKGYYDRRSREVLLPRPCKVRSSELAVGSRILTLVGVTALVAVLAGYVYLQVRGVTAPPTLTLVAPEEGMTLNAPVVLVKGQTANDVTVNVNGRTAIVQPDGSFEMRLDVPRGTTAIDVVAKKRHGRESVITRHILFDRPLPSMTGFVDVTSSAL